MQLDYDTQLLIKLSGFICFFYIWLIDLFEYTFYLANFLKIIHPLYKN